MELIGSKKIKANADCKYVLTTNKRSGDDNQINIPKEVSILLGWTESKETTVKITKENLIEALNYARNYEGETLYHKGEKVSLDKEWFERQNSILKEFFSDGDLKDYTLTIRIEKDGRCFALGFSRNSNLNIQEFIIPNRTIVTFYRDEKDIYLHLEVDLENNNEKKESIQEKNLTTFSLKTLKFLIKEFGDGFLKDNIEEYDTSTGSFKYLGYKIPKYFNSTRVFGVFKSEDQVNDLKNSNERFRFHNEKLNILGHPLIFFTTEIEFNRSEKGSNLGFDDFKNFVEDYSVGQFTISRSETGIYQLLLKEDLLVSKELILSVKKSLRSFAFKAFKIIHKEFGDNFLDQEKVFSGRKHGEVDIQAVTFPTYFGNKKILGIFDVEQTKESLKTSTSIRFNPENLKILNQSFIYFSSQWSHPDDPTHPNFGEFVNFTRAYGEGRYEIEYDENQSIYNLYKVSNQFKVNINMPIQKIYFGSPGTGKSRLIKNKIGSDWLRITFHPELDYQGFVGSYKPTMKPSTGGGLTEEISYEYVPESFIKAYCKAWKTDTPYYLIIEEINRGNCAQIFGDIFQLLDRGEDGYSEYPIECSPDIQRFLKKEFESDFDRSSEYEKKTGTNDFSKMVLPNNLSVLATMNTSDQSLFPMDSAFKRRWDWQYVPIDYDDANKNIKVSVGEIEYNWGGFIREVNKQVKQHTQSEDKQLGNRFVSPANGVISTEQFVSKVLFYLWSEIYKDEQGTGNTIFINADTGSEVTFGEFFDTSGDVINEVVIGFLRHVLPGENPIEKNQGIEVEK